MKYKIIIAAVVLFLLMGGFVGRKQIEKWALGARSKRNLSGVTSNMKAVTERALQLSPYDFGVTSGKRSAEEQNELYKSGASQLDGFVRQSKHQGGKAVDIAVYDENGSITWKYEYFEAVSVAFKQAAKELGVSIRWGGDWTSFVDAPHFEEV